MTTTARPAHAAKAEIVKEIINNFKNAQCVAIAEYKSLNVDQMTRFRREALHQNVQVKVYKDSLVRRAVKELGLDDLEVYLTQQNVFIFSNEDPVAAAKLVAKFAKDNDAMKLKAGVYEGKALDTAGIQQVAAFPSREEALSMFASALVYPLRQFMTATQEVAHKNGE